MSWMDLAFGVAASPSLKEIRVNNHGVGMMTMSLTRGPSGGFRFLGWRGVGARRHSSWFNQKGGTGRSDGENGSGSSGDGKGSGGLWRQGAGGGGFSGNDGNPLMPVWDFYSGMMVEQPLPTKMVTAAIAAVMEMMIRQRSSKLEDVLFMALRGALVFAIPLSYYFSILENAVPGASFAPVLIKSIIHCTGAATAVRYLEDVYEKVLHGTQLTTERSLLFFSKSGSGLRSFWIPWILINFTFVPLELRVPMLSLGRVLFALSESKL